jgi:hypothetical protein
VQHGTLPSLSLQASPPLSLSLPRIFTDALINEEGEWEVCISLLYASWITTTFQGQLDVNVQYVSPPTPCSSFPARKTSQPSSSGAYVSPPSVVSP